MVGLDCPALHTRRVRHPLHARSAHGAQIEMILEQRAQQLAPVSLDPVLQLQCSSPPASSPSSQP